MVEPQSEEPRFEVLVRVDTSDIAVVAGFDAVGGKLEILVGVEHRSKLTYVAGLLASVATYIKDAESWEWIPAVRSGHDAGYEKSDTPF